MAGLGPCGGQLKSLDIFFSTLSCINVADRVNFLCGTYLPPPTDKGF